MIKKGHLPEDCFEANGYLNKCSKCTFQAHYTDYYGSDKSIYMYIPNCNEFLMNEAVS